MHNGVLRRTLLISFWPITDFIVTVLANVLLVNAGVVRAVATTTIIGSLFNIIFIWLLGFEKELYGVILRKTKGIVRFQNLSAKIGKTFAVLAAYTISGPAMLGAPLIWLLGIRGRRAYMLAVAGITINSIFWVGGVYHLFWVLVRAAIHTPAIIFF